MNKEKLHNLIAQWSRETQFLSVHNTEHPAYKSVISAGLDALPFLLERLEDSIGHDEENGIDTDNCPWFSVLAISDITNSECLADFPENDAGQLDKLRGHILNWGRTK